MKKTRKRLFAFSALFLLIAQVLVMSLCNITAIAVTQSENSKELFNNEHGSANISYEEAASGNLNWTVNLQKATSDVATRFMMDLTADGVVVIPENVKTSEQTNPEIQLQNINESGEKTGTLFEPTAGSISGSAVITFETSSDLANLKVKPKLMEVTEDGSDNDLLAENPGVVFDLATVASSTVASSDTVASSTATSSDQETVTSTTTSEEAVVESTVDSSEAIVDSTEAVTETTEESTIETAESSDETTETQESTETSESTEASEAEEETTTPSVNYAPVSVLAGSDLPTGNQLVISSEVDNDINKVQVDVTGTNGYYIKTKTGQKGSFSDGLSAWENNVYLKYGNISGDKAVIFNSKTDASKATIKVTYPEIGTYNDTKIGAILTITDIKVANDQFGKLDVPAIDFASKLYDGMFYGLMTGLTVNIQFVYKDTTTAIPVDRNNTYMTFASLNNSVTNDNWGSEFVIPRYDTTAYVTKNTSLEKGTPEPGTEVNNTYPYSGTQAYYGARYFGDNLEDPTYVNGAVSFQFGDNSTGSTYSLGSLAGSAWTSFMSSLLVPVDMGAPDKRVTQQNDWEHRDSDELDILIEKQKEVTVNDIPKHEYIINQPLYNVDQSIARPDSITLTDTFPLYVKPTHVKVLQAHGEVANRAVTPKEADGRYSITFTLTKDEMAKVVFDGDDISWVVDVEVSEDAIAKANATHEKVLMDNIANVSFDGTTISHNTNKVETQVIPDLEITVEKIWEDDGNKYGLRQPITLQLQQSFDKEIWKPYGKNFDLATDTTTLSKTFKNVPAVVNNKPAYYRVVELINGKEGHVVGYGDPNYSEPRIISAGDMDASTGKLPVLQVTNTLLKTDLSFIKVGNDGSSPLKGIEFNVTGNNGYKESDTSKGDGSVGFSDLPYGKYTLTEKTPDGYKKAGPWDFEVKEKINEETGKREVEVVWTDNPLVDGKLVNTLNPFDLTVTKVDENDEALEGATFQLIGQDVDYNKTIDTGSIFTFTDLVPGKYILKETVAPGGYNAIQHEIEITIGQDGKVSISGDEGKNPGLDLNVDKNNTISIKVTNKPKSPLPATGGPGTWIFMATGALALTATGLYFIRRKDQEVA
ncbi:SpaA isopeptide-forming pilin-related protein [Enterococcus diestrammenae]|uniref:SpaA isopeptide-forming pilin-related protein n=1 Tax=Enterococcus diestrammenae TaxID=1155073 RepID=UPI0022E36623|nr:SpaA isopeptide-forming pilin-related protein [Enterococcus diestrammenae]